MTKLMWAGVVLVASVAGPALAADLPARVYNPLPPAPFNWSGCYLGGQIGAQSGRWTSGVNYTNPVAPASGSRDFDSKGAFIGGAQVGCNYQPVASVFVIGVEGDVLGAKNTASGEVFRYATTPTDHFDAGGKIGSQGNYAFAWAPPGTGCWPTLRVARPGQASIRPTRSSARASARRCFKGARLAPAGISASASTMHSWGAGPLGSSIVTPPTTRTITSCRLACVRFP